MAPKNITRIVKKLLGEPLIFSYYIMNGEIVIKTDSGYHFSSLNSTQEKNIILFELDMEDILAGNI